MSEHSAENDAQEFNACPKCGQPVPAPFRAHIENLGGCPERIIPPGVNREGKP